MTTTVALSGKLFLDRLTGPDLAPIAIEAGKPVTFGRSSQSEIQLPDQTVSRRHCSIARRVESWVVTDLGSRHGTYVNGARLEPQAWAPIDHGDTLNIGPWTLRVRTRGDSGPVLATTDDSVMGASRVQRVATADLATLARHRLTLLMECAASIHAAGDEAELARKVLDAILAGTGFTRGAIVRNVGDTEQVELIAAVGVNPGSANFQISRSLLKAASAGEVVRLSEDSSLMEAVSIVQMGVQAAICAPIQVGTIVSAFVYVDSPERGRRAESDAAEFCGAIAGMGGLALSNIKRRTLEQWQRTVERDILAAHNAQKRIMPPDRGTVGPISYSLRSKPGRFVAGDLFDIVPMPDGRAGLFLGDVMGKGIGAAIVMATTQAKLNALLRETGDPGAALTAINRWVVEHSEDRVEFISLFAALFDPKGATLEFVDAGHGYWIHVPSGGRPVPVECDGGLLVGADAGTIYKSERITLSPGDRIVVFSDGLVEQPSPDGDAFGVERVIQALAESGSPDQDVSSLLASLIAFANTDALADDVTIGSVVFGAA